MVENHLAKVGVTGSSPVHCSKFFDIMIAERDRNCHLLQLKGSTGHR